MEGVGVFLVLDCNRTEELADPRACLLRQVLELNSAEEVLEARAGWGLGAVEAAKTPELFLLRGMGGWAPSFSEGASCSFQGERSGCLNAGEKIWEEALSLWSLRLECVALALT